MTELQDKQLTCADCGGTFTWSAKDQEFFRDRGYDAPKRCQWCRLAKKQRWEEGHRGGGKR